MQKFYNTRNYHFLLIFLFVFSAAVRPVMAENAPGDGSRDAEIVNAFWDFEADFEDVLEGHAPTGGEGYGIFDHPERGNVLEMPGGNEIENSLVFGNTTGITGNTPRLIMFWFYAGKLDENGEPIDPDNVNDINNGVITSWGINSNGERFTIRLSNQNQVRMEIQGNFAQTIDDVVFPHTWHHVILRLEDVEDASTDQITIWVDGVERTLNTGNQSVLVNTAESDFAFGSQTLAGQRALFGYIDDFLIMNQGPDDDKIFGFADTTIGDDLGIELDYPGLGGFHLSLEADPEDAGVLEGAGQYPAGEEVTVTALASDGYVFAEWLDADGEQLSTDASFDFTMPEVDVVLTASFVEDDVELFTLDLVADPAGAADLSGAGFYAAGETIAVSAEAHPGYIFESWTGADDEVVSLAPDFEFEMPSEDITLTANLFVPDPILVPTHYASTAEAFMAVVNAVDVYPAGSSVTIHIEGEGYTVGWTGGTQAYIAPGNSLSRPLHITIEGSGANVTTLKGFADEDMPDVSEGPDNRGLRFFQSNGAHSGLHLTVQNLKMENWGFGNTNGGVFNFNQSTADGMTLSLVNMEFENMLARVGAIVQSTHANNDIIVDNVYVHNSLSFDNNEISGLFQLVNSSLTITNSTFMSNHQQVLNVGSTNSGEDRGLRRGSIVSLRSGQADHIMEVTLTNNVFVNNLVEEEASTSFEQPVFSIEVRNETSDVNLDFADNAMIGNHRAGDTNDVDVLWEDDQGLVSWAGSQGNLINAAVSGTGEGGEGDYQSAEMEGFTIDEVFDYTHPQINFTMDGDLPQVFFDSFGVGFLEYDPVELPEEYSAVFIIEDEAGNPVYDAVILLDNMENDIGDYVFDNLEPGIYTYTAITTCYPTEEGQIEVVDANVEHLVVLQIISGDANGDGIINVLDIMAVANYFSGNDPDPFCFVNADINDDGIINILDLVGILNIFTKGAANPLPMLESEVAKAFLGQEALVLKSDGTLAGVQFEISGVNAEDVITANDLHGFEIMYAAVGDVMRVLIFSLDNIAIPAGKVELLRFDSIDHTPAWISIKAANQNADPVYVSENYNAPTNINILTESADITVFPNPADKYLWISFNEITGTDLKISLTNPGGQTVKKARIMPGQSLEKRMSLEGILPGLYFLKIENQDTRFVEKVIVK